MCSTLVHSNISRNRTEYGLLQQVNNILRTSYICGTVCMDVMEKKSSLLHIYI
jgi:hypothetical protein